MSASNIEYEVESHLACEDLTLRRIFQGPTFRFNVVGGGYTVHQKLVARVSEPLKALMSNGMKESQDGSSELKETNKATFGRFVEFMYTGDYNAAEPTTPTPDPASDAGDEIEQGTHPIGAISDEENGFERHEAVPEEDLILPTSSSRRRRKVKKVNIAAGSQFPILEFDYLVQRPLQTSSEFEHEHDWSLDYLPVFLSHAHLYVFADSHDIAALQVLTCNRLHDALSQFNYSSGSVTDIAELVEYAYEHTTNRSQKIDNLRAIVTHFCAKNIAALKASATFLEILKQGGDFVEALVDRMCYLFEIEEP